METNGRKNEACLEPSIVDSASATLGNNSRPIGIDVPHVPHIDAPNRIQAIHAQNRAITLDQAAQQIADYEQRCRHYVATPNEISVRGDHLIAGPHEFRLDGSGMRRLCRRLGAPAAYLGRLGPELRSQILEYHLRDGISAKPKSSQGNSRVTARDDLFLDLDRNDLFVLSGSDAIQSLREGVGPDAAYLQVQNLSIRDEMIVADLVSPRIARDVRPGDIIQAGIRIEHSLLGEGATTICAYFFRLICSNGMVHRECAGSRRTSRTRRIDSSHPNAHELQKAQIRRLASDNMSVLLERLETIRELSSNTVKDALGTMEHFVRRSRLYSGNIMQLLRAAWEHEGSESTGYGILNAMTRAATHSTELTDRQRRSLARLAGIFATHRVHICPRCFSVVHGGPNGNIDE